MLSKVLVLSQCLSHKEVKRIFVVLAIFTPITTFMAITFGPGVIYGLILSTLIGWAMPFYVFRRDL